MSQAGEIRRLLNTKFQAKQDRIGALPGELGDGYGHLSVDGREHYVYCRLAGAVAEVYNNRIPAENDLLVMVGYDPAQPELFQVLSTRTALPGGSNGGAVTGYAPAKRYQYMATGGGQDPLFVEQRAYLPLRIGALAGMNLQIYRGKVWTGSAWKAIPTHNFSLASYLPTDAGKAALVLITIDNTGAVVKTKGAEFTLADMTTAELVLAQLPAVPDGTREVLGAVRVYAGQTAIQEARSNTDILDLRGSGWSAAGAASGDVTGPASSVDGHLAVFDGTSGKLLKDGGAIPVGGSVGWGNVFPLTLPVLAEFTWVNQGTTSAAQASNGIYITTTNTDSYIHMLVKAAPTPPYTVTGAFIGSLGGNANSELGLVFRESSSGKLHYLGATSGSISNYKWNNPTSYAGSPYPGVVTTGVFGPIFLRIGDDGTYRRAAFSTDGVNFAEWHTVARTDFLTADQIGFFARTGDSNVRFTVLSFKVE